MIFSSFTILKSINSKSKAYITSRNRQEQYCHAGPLRIFANISLNINRYNKYVYIYKQKPYTICGSNKFFFYYWNRASPRIVVITVTPDVNLCAPVSRCVFLFCGIVHFFFPRKTVLSSPFQTNTKHFLSDTQLLCVIIIRNDIGNTLINEYIPTLVLPEIIQMLILIHYVHYVICIMNLIARFS